MSSPTVDINVDMRERYGRWGLGDDANLSARPLRPAAKQRDHDDVPQHVRRSAVPGHVGVAGANPRDVARAQRSTLARAGE